LARPRGFEPLFSP